VTVPGRCVEHELDFVAVREDERIAAEAKFHNNSALKSDIKVALYVQARFEDIAAGATHQGPTDYTTRMVITNTKFTSQAEMYGTCAGLSLLSWDFPATGNLRELIEETRIHPVSCITTLSTAHKKRLMERGVVLCRQVRERVDELESLGLTTHAIERVLVETDSLCATQ
jgi:hypothetical protein